MIEDTHRYLIIGGTTKAATTSLFFYLVDHPEVCASSMKETRFFLDKEYPLKSRYRFEDGVEKYAKYFLHCDDQTTVRVEATPDYLYSPGTPLKIKQSLPNAKLVFILRNPVTRLISWYRFARQRNLIPSAMSFDDYVREQLSNTSKTHRRDVQVMRTLEQGRYSIYLQSYFDVFGKEKIHVVFFEELTARPQQILYSLCEFAAINPVFYTAYDFKVFNRTEDVKNPKIHRFYTGFRFYVRKHIYTKSTIHKILKQIRLFLDPIYFRLNRRYSEQKVHLAPTTQKMLKDYYKPELEKLTMLLDNTPPWGIFEKE